MPGRGLEFAGKAAASMWLWPELCLLAAGGERWPAVWEPTPQPRHHRNVFIQLARIEAQIIRTCFTEQVLDQGKEQWCAKVDCLEWFGLDCGVPRNCSCCSTQAGCSIDGNIILLIEVETGWRVENNYLKWILPRRPNAKLLCYFVRIQATNGREMKHLWEK